MKKPNWLKKANPEKQWKYEHTVSEGPHRGMVITVYNFRTTVGMAFDMVDEAMDWIDRKGAQEV